MIDIHSHIIPNVDDGSKSMEESISMIKEELKLGVNSIILTPHFRRRMFETSSDKIYLSFLNLQEEVKKLNLNIDLYLGQEIYIHSLEGFKKTLEMISNKEIYTFSNTKYILIEFSYTDDIDITEAAYMATVKGYVPIIAHIERYQYINSIEKVEEIMATGALVQVNASSVIGKDGGKAKRFIKKLIKKGYIDFVASDIHYKRINYMKDAYEYVVKKHGEEIANKLFNDNANKILINEIRGVSNGKE